MLTLPGIRNPISLARLILERSTKPLSLRRVPPNLLVGQGATDFAAEAGVRIHHPDLLISPAAGERFEKWKGELGKINDTQSNKSVVEINMLDSEDDKKQHDVDDFEHAPCWNESQPYSPSLEAVEPDSAVTSAADLTMPLTKFKRRRLLSSNEIGTDGQESEKSHDEGQDDDDERDDDEDYDSDSNIDDDFSLTQAPPPTRQHSLRHAHLAHHFSSEDKESETSSLPAAPPPTRVDSPSQTHQSALDGHESLTYEHLLSAAREDEITDTVGAIAVDCYGNIAAGSSSGGIGMKHKGRVGPAALVGIGSAVVPVDPGDRDKRCVATVTSGTGEHMATSMAAGTCASRLYTSSRRRLRGGSESTDDDNAMRCFVERDFMGTPALSFDDLCVSDKNLPILDHPSVKHSHSIGAIGILGVKKTADAIYLYFAHNTDSFVSRTFQLL